MASISEILESFSILHELQKTAPHTCDTTLGFRNLRDGAEPVEYRVHSTALMCTPYLLRVLTNDSFAEARERRVYFDLGTMCMHEFITHEHLDLLIALIYRDKAVTHMLSISTIKEPNDVENEHFCVRMLVLLEFGWVFGFSQLCDTAAQWLSLQNNTSLINYVDALCTPHIVTQRDFVASGGIQTVLEAMLSSQLDKVHKSYMLRTALIIQHFWIDYPQHLMIPMCRLNTDVFAALLVVLAQFIPVTRLLLYAFHVETYGADRVAVLCNVDAALEELVFEYLTCLAQLGIAECDIRPLAVQLLTGTIDYESWKRFRGGHFLSLEYLTLLPLERDARSDIVRKSQKGIRLAIVLYHTAKAPVVSSCHFSTATTTTTSEASSPPPIQRCPHVPPHVMPALYNFNQFDALMLTTVSSAFNGQAPKASVWTDSMYTNQANPRHADFIVHKHEETLLHGSVAIQRHSQASTDILYLLP